MMMEKIYELVQDPAWWFTAIFIAIVVSVISAFLLDGIRKALAHMSGRYRARKERLDRARQAKIEILASHETLLVIENSNSLVRIVKTGILIVMYVQMAITYVFLLPDDNPKAAAFLFTLMIGGFAVVSGFKMMRIQKVTHLANKAYREKLLQE